MPLGPIFDAEKKNLLAPPPKKSASNFCDLFQFTLSLIFTRPAAIWPFFVVFCFSIHTVHTVNSPNLPPPTHGGGGCMGGHSEAIGESEPGPVHNLIGMTALVMWLKLLYLVKLYSKLTF